MKRLMLVLVIFIIVANFSYALTEEEIFNEKENKLLLYSLSNNTSEIETSIEARAGKTAKLSDIGWSLSSDVSSNVKDVMNRLNLNYAMTTYLENEFTRVTIVYRRVRDQWFTCLVF